MQAGRIITLALIDEVKTGEDHTDEVIRASPAAPGAKRLAVRLAKALGRKHARAAAQVAAKLAHRDELGRFAKRISTLT